MKKIIFFLCILYFVSFTIFDNSYALKCVKASTGRSRFGDCLSIVHVAEYISNKYKITTIYQDFVESKNLLIQDKIDEIKKYNFKNFKIIKLNDENQINLTNGIDTIYEVRVELFMKYYFQILEHQDLKKKFKELIKPKYEIKMPCELKKNSINIAAHVRKGGGFDLPLLSKDGLFDGKNKNSNFNPIDADILVEKYRKESFPYSDLRWPHKFPPDSFFVEQIKKIACMFPDKKMHVHIFTDDQEPAELMNKYIKAVNNKNITFSCREKDNYHDKNIIDDFFAMTKFDCLIRPASRYSENIEILGDFKIVIWPEHSTWVEPDKLIIDKVNVINNLKQN